MVCSLYVPAEQVEISDGELGMKHTKPLLNAVNIVILPSTCLSAFQNAGKHDFLACDEEQNEG